MTLSNTQSIEVRKLCLTVLFSVENEEIRNTENRTKNHGQSFPDSRTDPLVKEGATYIQLDFSIVMDQWFWCAFFFLPHFLNGSVYYSYLVLFPSLCVGNVQRRSFVSLVHRSVNQKQLFPGCWEETYSRRLAYLFFCCVRS